MNSLIHQDTAPVQCPGSAPGTAVIVSLRPVPFKLCIRQRNRAEPAVFHRLFYQPCRVMKTALENAADQHVVFFRFLHNHTDSVFRNFHRFFNQDVLPCPDGGKRGLQVAAGRRRDADGINLRILQHLLKRIKGFAVMLLRPLVRFFLVLMDTAAQVAVILILQGNGMHFRDDAQPYDSESDFIVFHIYPLPVCDWKFSSVKTIPHLTGFEKFFPLPYESCTVCLTGGCRYDIMPATMPVTVLCLFVCYSGNGKCREALPDH